jgi:hypothetical protein
MPRNNDGGASQERETVHKSRSKEYRRMYHRAYYATVSACLPRPEKEAFKDACRRENKTQHEVIAELIADWMVMHGSFAYSAPPVVFK